MLLPPFFISKAIRGDGPAGSPQHNEFYHSFTSKSKPYFRLGVLSIAILGLIGIGELMVGLFLAWIPICGWIISWIVGLGIAFWTYLVVAYVYGSFAREVQLLMHPASAIA